MPARGSHSSGRVSRRKLSRHTSQGMYRGMDPHIWLDFDHAGVMVQNIADGLIAKDPANQDFFLAHARLPAGVAEYRTGLANAGKDCRTDRGNAGKRPQVCLLRGASFTRHRQKLLPRKPVPRCSF